METLLPVFQFPASLGVCCRLLMLVSLLSREHGAQGTQCPIQGAFLYVSMCLYVGHDFKTLPSRGFWVPKAVY